VPPLPLWVQGRVTGLHPAGLPHSEIPGSKPVCGSPRLIAACRVLLRPRAPRHPPYALTPLTAPRRRHRLPARAPRPARSRLHGLTSAGGRQDARSIAARPALPPAAPAAAAALRRARPRTSPSRSRSLPSAVVKVQFRQTQRTPSRPRPGIPAEPPGSTAQNGGDERNRTADPLLARQVLSR
jgi:hypothetical protein